MTPERKILVIAGPNGADCPIFVNADSIAAGLSPFRPSSVAFRAGHLMIETIHGYAARGESFAFETTLSGRGHARSIPLWRGQGYRVKLFFLRLPRPDMAIARAGLAPPRQTLMRLETPP